MFFIALAVVIVILVYNSNIITTGRMTATGTEEGITISFVTASSSPVFLYRGEQKILEINSGNKTGKIQVKNLTPGKAYTFSLRDQNGKLLSKVTCRAGGE